MSYINTNVSGVIAVNNLNKNNASLQTSLERLSTGYRINSGKDDLAGLIAAQSLAAEQQATTTAISNAQLANNIIETAEGSLSEVSSLLVSLQGLVGNAANSAGLSQDEKDADQLQVDLILSTVNRISNSASFQGVKLLNEGRQTHFGFVDHVGFHLGVDQFGHCGQHFAGSRGFGNRFCCRPASSTSWAPAQV